jgi:RNA 2',3'-cyclic 3'-phosphodiesterase
MPEQFSLPGFEPAPRATDRLFFAVFPDPDTALEIARLGGRLCAAHGLKGRPVQPRRLHVTLHHLGDYAGFPQQLVELASAAAQTVAMAPFDVAFDHARSFSGRPRNRPVVLLGDEGVVGLVRLHEALGTALEHAGLAVHANHTPRVTLLYGNHYVAEEAAGPVSWTVREFVLVHSLLGRARHVPLARWPLLP